MDINMPVMNGYVAARKIKDLRPDLPVIAVTAYAMTSDRISAQNAGCDDYISKPINNTSFYEMIAKYTT
jgi:CheY-like chemotaxis protein